MEPEVTTKKTKFFCFKHEEDKPELRIIKRGHVKKVVYCKKCRKQLFNKTINDLQLWKQAMKEKPFRDFGHSITLIPDSKYLIKSFSTVNEVPPCEYSIISVDREGKETLHLHFITNELDKERKGEFGNPIILTGKTTKTVILKGKGLSEASMPTIKVDMEKV